MTPTPPGLSDPDQAAFAWSRFRRMLGWVALVAAICSAGAVWGLSRWQGPLNWITILAAIGGVFGSVMMAGALMGLVFLSSGSGHDEAVGRETD
jgi:hypothetical protein